MKSENNYVFVGTPGGDRHHGIESRMRGRDGNDWLLAEDPSRVFGDDGNDVLVATDDGDSLFGGDGNDILVVDNAWKSTPVEGGAGNDRFVVLDPTWDTLKIADFNRHKDTIEIGIPYDASPSHWTTDYDRDTGKLYVTLVSSAGELLGDQYLAARLKPNTKLPEADVKLVANIEDKYDDYLL